ncbi:transcriptional regulator [Cupriavidus gilardii]|uniref:transcriptional regulator n=1 Tax=Cupriavidus gilardii TaxID=82541 RepID=UPI0007E387CA|nr:YdaS family helix-turn-helix protein [Cupriavidus gilardii]
MSDATLKSFLDSLPVEEREPFAHRCGTSFDYLRQVAYGNRLCREKLAARIERESGGAVKRQVLRPDDWHEVWPELVCLAR